MRGEPIIEAPEWGEKFGRGFIEGDIEVPWNFKPSFLVGETVTASFHGRQTVGVITRCWTRRKYPWGRKRVKFHAEILPSGEGG